MDVANQAVSRSSRRNLSWGLLPLLPLICGVTLTPLLRGSRTDSSDAKTDPPLPPNVRQNLERVLGGEKEKVSEKIDIWYGGMSQARRAPIWVGEINEPNGGNIRVDCDATTGDLIMYSQTGETNDSAIGDSGTMHPIHNGEEAKKIACQYLCFLCNKNVNSNGLIASRGARHGMSLWNVTGFAHDKDSRFPFQIRMDVASGELIFYSEKRYIADARAASTINGGL